MNINDRDFQKNNTLLLPSYIQDFIPIIRGLLERRQGEWKSNEIQHLLTDEAKKLLQQDMDLRWVQYTQELIEIGFTSSIYEFDRIEFGGDDSREIQFYMNVPSKKVRIKNRGAVLGYTDFYESVFFGMSVICNEYRVILSRLDKHNDFQSVFDPETPEDQKVFDMIEIFMKRRGYDRIETKLLDIPLPMKGELYGIPTDIHGCPSSEPFTVRHLLFGE